MVITQDIYGHVLPGMQRQAAGYVETIWKGAREQGKEGAFLP